MNFNLHNFITHIFLFPMKLAYLYVFLLKTVDYFKKVNYLLTITESDL